MTEIQTRAFDIIVRWIDHAREKALTKHLVWFWYIRDLAEGLSFAKKYFSGIMLFLHTQCKYSPDREVLVQMVKETCRVLLPESERYNPQTDVDKDSEGDTY